MEGVYDVALGSRTIGSVNVSKVGLYYQFRCRCQLTGQVICRLIASCGEQRVDLGVLVPGDGGFGLETRIPVKRLGTGELTFHAESKHSQIQGQFVPIRPEEPFSYLSKLCGAYLAERNGQIGAVIQEDQTVSSSPTGQ